MKHQGLQIVSYQNAADFLDDCGDVLHAAPDLNHSILQVANLIGSSSEYFSPPHNFWSVTSGKNSVACALSTQPDGLVTTEVPKTAISGLSEAVKGCGKSVRRILSPPGTAHLLREELFGDLPETDIESCEWVIGRLDAIEQAREPDTHYVRQATVDDIEQTSVWARQYAEERPAFLDVESFFSQKLASGELYLLEAGEPRAMAAVSGQTLSGTRISAVFTPEEHRSNGYASKIVCELSSRLLRNGAEFVLLTWRADDGVGKLYRRIGFREVGRQKSFSVRRAFR